MSNDFCENTKTKTFVLLVLFCFYASSTKMSNFRIENTISCQIPLTNYARMCYNDYVR